MQCMKQPATAVAQTLQQHQQEASRTHQDNFNACIQVRAGVAHVCNHRLPPTDGCNCGGRPRHLHEEVPSDIMVAAPALRPDNASSQATHWEAQHGHAEDSQ